MSVYYNEFDPFAAAWLRELIREGHIPPGEVDERDIKDVKPTDLVGFAQCHFFAGIGGWPYALRLAGWPDDQPVWTGSCPCQPFSQAGKRKGKKDKRHLWPEFRRLIKETLEEREIPVIVGEQVASKDGRVWLAGVRADLEALGYEVGAGDLCAAGIGSPHIRQRLFWIGYTTGARRACEPGSFRHTDIGGKAYGLEHADPAGCRELCGAQPVSPQLRRPERAGRESWDDFNVIPCADGKARRLKPGLAPLVDGFPGRVGQLRGYGNAIVPQVAAEFIKAFLETQEPSLITGH